MKRIIPIILALTLLCGCAGKGSLESVNIEFCPTAPEEADLSLAGPLLTDFGIRLLRQTALEGENALISPLSVMTALSMTACGAQSKTLSQMEQVLGADRETLNLWLANYQAFVRGEANAVHMANALWLRDDPGLQVGEEFLKDNASFFGSDIFTGPFDHSTRKSINTWIEANTNGRIADMLTDIPPNAAIYLINALAFDAPWEEPYEPYQVRGGEFTSWDGKLLEAEMMASTEHYYLETPDATGFLKYYEGRDYAFAALLPREGMTPQQLLECIDGAQLHGLLSAPEDMIVYAQVPKFQVGYGAELSEPLAAMGMGDAFKPDLADFSRMGRTEEGSLYLSSVLHRSFLQLDELGTKAGAATIVEVPAGGAMMEQETRTVTLNRPFVYMIIDCQWKQPVFIGILSEPG